jgi:hypothetical protein
MPKAFARPIVHRESETSTSKSTLQENRPTGDVSNKAILESTFTKPVTSLERARPVSNYPTRTFGGNLWQGGSPLCRSIVNQDLQHRKPAEQLSAGLLSGLFLIVVGLEVTIDHQREALGRRHIRSLNISWLSFVG